VHLLVAIEMDRPGEVRAGLVFLDLLLEKKRVRADDRELLLGDDALDDLGQILVEERPWPCTASIGSRRASAWSN